MLTADPDRATRYRQARARIRAMARDERSAALGVLAQHVRARDVEMIRQARLGHIGSDLSVADILVTLYAAVLDIDPANPDAEDRDRFILSKGHSAGVLYAVLAECGFFAPDELRTFAQPMSALNGHPNRTKVPGVETNTGPLGHGFPVAVGCALAGKLRALPYRTFVVLGDGELQEGSNWEAAMTASHYGLDRLTAVIDRNWLQQGARTEETKRLEPLAEKWSSFGFEVRESNGHDYGKLFDSLDRIGNDRPVCVIAQTTKGRGVSFMEDRVEWHHKVPSAEQAQVALAELNHTAEGVAV
jgi:transketolase